MSEIVLLVGTISAYIVDVLTAVFTHMRKSRCTSVSCCGMKCDRDVLQDRESRRKSVENQSQRNCSAFDKI